VTWKERRNLKKITSLGLCCPLLELVYRRLLLLRPAERLGTKRTKIIAQNNNNNPSSIFAVTRDWISPRRPKLGNARVIFSNFQTCAWWKKYLKDSKQIFVLGRSRKSVRFVEQIMSVDKYPSILWRQMEFIVFITHNNHSCKRLFSQDQYKLMAN